MVVKIEGSPGVRKREQRFVRAATLARRRLVRIRILCETFGPTPPERWRDPYPVGFLLRHVFWAGEDAGVWRFGLPFPRWPDAEEARRVFAPAWRSAFMSDYDDIDRRISDWSARPMSDGLNQAFVEGLRRADRMLSSLVRGGGGDALMEEIKADYAALKRRQHRMTVLFSPDRLYAFGLHQALWSVAIGPPLAESRLVAALWRRRRAQADA